MPGPEQPYGTIPPGPPTPGTGAAAPEAETKGLAGDSVSTAPSGAPAIVPLGTPLPSQFGRYRIEKLLGRGGMGSVYLARDTQLGDRPVALKVPLIQPDADSTYRERFYREARAAARLTHPHICAIYDVGTLDGILFLSMAFIEGQPLNHRLRGQPVLPQPEAAALVRKLALALDEAHQRGIVHRDLKPGNVMIDRRGEPVIMDFGLAWENRPGHDSRLTQSGEMLGTPAYMPPEQITGDLKATGPVCDIYSLGVILFELVTGRLPFTGSGPAVLAKVLMEEAPAPSSLRPDLDPILEAACQKAMAKKTADRFASMKEFAAALDQFLTRQTVASASVTVAAPKLQRPPSPPAPVRRRRKAPWLVALLLLAIGGGAAVVAVLRPELIDQLWSALGPGPTDTSSPAASTRKEGLVPTRQVPPTTPVAPSGKGGLLRTFEDHRERIMTLAFAPDGDTFVSGSGGKGTAEGTVRRWDPRNGTMIGRIDHMPDATSVPKGIERVGFSPDGRRTFFISWDVALWVKDHRAGTVTRVAETGPTIIPAAVFMADGRTLLFAEPDPGFGNRLRLLDLQEKAKETYLEGKTGYVVCLAASADGRWAVSGGLDGDMILWDVRERKESRRWKAFDESVIEAAFSRNGKQILAGSRLGRVKAWDAVSGEQLSYQAGHSGTQTRCLAFSADGRLVLAGSGKLPTEKGEENHVVWIWQTATGKVLQRFPGHTGTIRAAAFSPDGRQAVSGGEDRVIRLWDLGQ